MLQTPRELFCSNKNVNNDDIKDTHEDDIADDADWRENLETFPRWTTDITSITVNGQCIGTRGLVGRIV